MTLLGDAVVKIRTDNSEVDKGFADVKKKAEGTGSVLKTALGAAGGFVIAQGLLQLPGALSSVVSAGSDMNEVVSKSNTIFKENAGEINKWAAGGAKDFGLSKKAALDAAGGLGNMFDQLGFGIDQTTDMSKGIVTLAADFASFHNADISDVLGAQQAAFRGEYDSLQRFLPLINAATVEQEAMAETGKANAKQLTAQEKAAAVYQLMLKGAGEAAGDFDRTSNGLANRQRILGAEFANLKDRIGQGLLPIVVALAGFLLNTLIPTFGKIANAASGPFNTVIGIVKTLIDYFNFVAISGDNANDFLADLPTGPIQDIAKYVGELVIKFQEALPSIKEFATELGGNLLDILMQLIGVIVQYYGNIAKLVLNVASVVLAIGEWVAQSGLLGVALTGLKTIIDVVGAVILAVTGFLGDHKIIAIALAAALGILLVALFPIPAAILAIILAVGLIVEGWGLLKRKTEELWNSLPSPIQAALSFIGDFVKTKIDGIIQMFQGWLTIITNVVGLFVNLITGDWAGAWENVKNIASGALDILEGLVKATFGNIPGIILGALGGIKDAASDIGNSIIDGVMDLINSLPDKVMGVINGLKTSISNFKLNIHVGGQSLGPLGHLPEINETLQPFSFLATGTPRIPFDNFPAMLHKNEAVIPANLNPFNPSATRPLTLATASGRARGGGAASITNNSGMNISLPNATIIADTREHARKGIENVGLGARMRARGLAR